MRDTLKDRYGPHSKKKGKKRIQAKEGGLLRKSFDWLKWKADRIGGITIYHPCLEH